MATVIFKPTEACNSRCIYCEVVKKTRGPKRMTFKILELFFRRVNEFLVERPQEEMEIIWHGGEPLLLGPGYSNGLWNIRKSIAPRPPAASSTLSRATSPCCPGSSSIP